MCALEHAFDLHHVDSIFPQSFIVTDHLPRAKQLNIISPEQNNLKVKLAINFAFVGLLVGRNVARCSCSSCIGSREYMAPNHVPV